jgi:predicted transcriptional regulator
MQGMRKATHQKKRKKPESRAFSIRLQLKQMEALDQLAEKKGITRNSLIQLAIAQMLEQGIKIS